MNTYRPLLAAIASGVALSGLLSGAASAQQMIELKVTTASVPNDIHTRALHVFRDTLNTAQPGRFDIQLFDSGTLFAQGPHITALQRGNAEVTYLSFQDIATEVPEYSIFTAGYLFRSPEHQIAVMDSEIGDEVRRRVAEDMGIQLLSICYLGTRQLNLRDDRVVNVPADLEGVNLRMPGSEAWLFLGNALGANATPMSFGEVYLGLQTGAIDAQDNPLPTVEAARFYEVTSQIVLTSHLVDALNIAVNNQTWEMLSEDERASMQDAADAACEWNNAERVDGEASLLEFFTDEGLTVHTPDVDAFREHVQAVYMNSDLAQSWPDGWLDQINAIE